MTSINNSYGRYIDDLLSQPADKDAITSALVSSGNKLDASERLVGEAFTISDDEQSRKSFYKKLTGRDIKTGEQVPDTTALQQLAMRKYDKSQQVFTTLQKLKEQAHEMMMQIIRMIGRNG